MKTPLTREILWARIKKFFWIWLAAAVVAGIAVLVYNAVSNKALNTVSAKVNFSYEGVSEGMDPNGNRFSIDDVKNEAIVRKAAEAAALNLSDAQLALVRSGMSVEASLPQDVIKQVTSYESIYSNSSVSMVSSQRARSYYPTAYTIRLDYKAAGLSRAQGADLLNAVLREYETYFYEKYGYKDGLEQDLRSFNFEDYDYEDAVTILDSTLEQLYGYVQSMAKKDKTNFRSSQTGYSFNDLLSAINTIRTQDISRISSYVSNNNVTKKWNEKVNQLTYTIETETRKQLMMQERIDALNEAIKNYVKPQTVVMGAAATSGEDGSTSMYRISQHSEAYDALLEQRVELQTQYSEIQERINKYQQRIDNSRIIARLEDTAYTRNELTAIMAKLDTLLTSLRLTANEYYTETALSRAFQITTPVKEKTNVLDLIRNSLADGIAVEGIVFGVFLLAAASGKSVPRKQNRAVKAAAQKA